MLSESDDSSGATGATIFVWAFTTPVKANSKLTSPQTFRITRVYASSSSLLGLNPNDFQNATALGTASMRYTGGPAPAAAATLARSMHNIAICLPYPSRRMLCRTPHASTVRPSDFSIAKPTGTGFPLANAPRSFGHGSTEFSNASSPGACVSSKSSCTEPAALLQNFVESSPYSISSFRIHA
eukprot:30628-Pelagococcus_subviridis.AAC.9